MYFGKEMVAKGIHTCWGLPCAQYRARCLVKPSRSPWKEGIVIIIWQMRNLRCRGDLPKSMRLIIEGAEIHNWACFCIKQVPFHLRAATFQTSLSLSSSFVRLASTPGSHVSKRPLVCSSARRYPKSNSHKGNCDSVIKHFLGRRSCVLLLILRTQAEFVVELVMSEFFREKPVNNAQVHVGLKIFCSCRKEPALACQEAESLLGLGWRIWLMVQGQQIWDRLESWDLRAAGHCAAVQACEHHLILLSLFPHLENEVSDDIFLQKCYMRDM